MRFKKMLTAALAALTMFAATAGAQTEGREYTRLDPAKPTLTQGKIEVLEFFSFACIHCYRLHGVAKAWAAKAPADVAFVRVPVTFDRANMVPLAKLFYALETSGDLDRLDTAVFQAYHDQEIVLATDQAVLDWVAKQGLDMAKFTSIYNSFGVQSKVKRAEQLTKTYNPRGTPAVYVAGRYAVRNDGVSSYDQIMQVAGQLVDKARADLKPRGGR